MVFFYILLIFILGLVIGSFIAAYTYRLPRRISIKSGRSFCPHCHKTISWYDNIPLLSFLLIEGKCRFCKKKISARYPIIELAFGIGFLEIFHLLTKCATTFKGSTLQGSVFCQFQSDFGVLSLPLLLFFFSVLLAILVIDFEHQVIPDNLVFILLFTYYLLFIFSDSPTFYISLGVGFGSALFFLVINLITKGGGMGLGDVKFGLFAGSFLRWPQNLVWLFLAFFIGAVVGIILIFLGTASLRKPIAFGPFLIISLFITAISGKYLLELFLQ